MFIQTSSELSESLMLTELDQHSLENRLSQDCWYFLHPISPEILKVLSLSWDFSIYSPSWNTEVQKLQQEQQQQKQKILPTLPNYKKSWIQFNSGGRLWMVLVLSNPVSPSVIIVSQKGACLRVLPPSLYNFSMNLFSTFTQSICYTHVIQDMLS